MSGSSLRPASEDALDRACRDVEETVSRVAKVVLHASALADRMDALAPAGASPAPQHQERLRLLRGAAEAGRRTLGQVPLAAAPGDMGTPSGGRAPG